MESTAAAPVVPQAPTVQPRPSPKRHHRRTYNNSNLVHSYQLNQQSYASTPRYYVIRRQGRNTLSEQNDNNSPGQSSEGSDQSPTQNGPRGRQRGFNDQSYQAKRKKVIVTGYPTYTNSNEILKLLGQFGSVYLEKCNKIVTVLNFEREEEAQAAVDASEQIILYGKFLKVKRYTSRQHVQEMAKSAKRTKTMQAEDEIIHPKDIDLEGDFYDQMTKLEAAIRLTVEEIENISKLYTDVENILQNVYPGCKAIPFGSITTGLGIKTSDADCFVELPARMMCPGVDVAFVGVAKRLLCSRPDLFTEVVSIPGANTPIVKFRHVATGTRCDLNCKTPLGTLNSRLVRALLASDSRLLPAALVLKYWARAHQLSGSGRLTNYALVLLLVFYLQARHVLPAVAALQPRSAATPVDHWDAGFLPSLLKPALDVVALPHLLGGFFEFYQQFNFEMLVVCPYLGRALPKTAFEGDGAETGLERYSENVRRRWVAPLRHASAMVVQDPIEQSHNVTTGMSKNLVTDFRQYIAFAADKYHASLPTCRNFLPGILLEAPEKVVKRPSPVRVRVAARSLRAVAGEWRAVLRRLLVDDVFQHMLALRLEPVPPRDGDKPEVHERYKALATRVTWAGRRYAEMNRIDAKELKARESTTGARLARTAEGPLDDPVKLDIELVWGDTPRTLMLVVRAPQGDVDAFKSLANFLTTTLPNWINVLIKPHLVQPPRPTQAPATQASVAPATQASVAPATQASVAPATQALVTPATQASVTPANQASGAPETQASAAQAPAATPTQAPEAKTLLTEAPTAETFASTPAAEAPPSLVSSMAELKVEDAVK